MAAVLKRVNPVADDFRVNGRGKAVHQPAYARLIVRVPEFGVFKLDQVLAGIEKGPGHAVAVRIAWCKAQHEAVVPKRQSHRSNRVENQPERRAMRRERAERQPQCGSVFDRASVGVAKLVRVRTEVDHRLR